jgi:hypothetical protein
MRHDRQLSLMILLALAGWMVASDAHQDSCHRRHSCPSDHNTYVCGDRGRCDQRPDNEFCVAGKPRAAGQQPSPSVIPSPAQIQTATVTRVIDGDTLQLIEFCESKRKSIAYAT